MGGEKRLANGRGCEGLAGAVINGKESEEEEEGLNGVSVEKGCVTGSDEGTRGGGGRRRC